ncbi:MAG TPA: type II toxin-antitoxin system RelE/ParE family toxin [Campylobacterales bacterium]|nr:type II toxin-antitoxin system RelE/ParE family toxin [Campylobacterales bacterium]
MRAYKVDILEFAYEDMRLGKYFYNEQDENLGRYFVNSVLTDIESLSFYGGIHVKYFGFHRMLAKRFPYAIYYDVEDNLVIVYAVLDLRENPLKSYEKLLNRM